MNADVLPILTYGSLMLLTGCGALVLIMRGDLVPRSVMSAEGRFVVGGVLGFGMAAFSIKLVVIAAFGLFPAQTIDVQLPDMTERQAKYEQLRNTPLPGSAHPALFSSRQKTWRALPAAAPTPADNPGTAKKIALGELLFHDPALSADRTVSCATCHDVKTGAGADATATAIGITKVPGPRNTPTVFNAAFQARLFWDGRATSLEDQATGPLINPNEMGMPSLDAVVARVAENDVYQKAFAEAFDTGSEITIEHIAKAIAAYERTLVTPDTPYDRFVGGDDDALTESQKRGMYLFRSLGCANCHSGPNFSGASLVGPRSPFQLLFASRSELALHYGLDQDKGRADAQAQNGIWRVPSLRNVALTAPYFHNGSVTDLTEAVRVMASAQLAADVDAKNNISPLRVLWSPETKSLSGYRKKQISSQGIEDIVAFLHALSSDTLVQRQRSAVGMTQIENLLTFPSVEQKGHTWKQSIHLQTSQLQGGKL
ncbi:cytochrome-c peroxidase [Magnetovibrio sp.]|uniref:cytochrome-c peroxidase n=1 Tax=Magnetovibrio sp. TaxID=2024836 RepID=UPI002F95D995